MTDQHTPGGPVPPARQEGPEVGRPPAPQPRRPENGEPRSATTPDAPPTEQAPRPGVPAAPPGPPWPAPAPPPPPTLPLLTRRNPPPPVAGGAIGLVSLLWTARRYRRIVRIGAALVPFVAGAVLLYSAQLYHDQQQQNLWTEGAHLQAKAARACSAIGGHLQGGYSVSSGGVSMWGSCAADPNRTYNDGGLTLSCGGVSVSLNANGTLNQQDLQSAERHYPGCFGSTHTN